MSKRKLTSVEKAAKKRRKALFMTIFINGKQKQVRRPVLIDGLDPYEFMLQNADPIWLHQEGMWEHISEESNDQQIAPTSHAGINVD